MTEFLQTSGFLIVTLIQQALLALSLYYPYMAGQLSLASPGFYALGGYVAAIAGTSEILQPARDSLGFWIYPIQWITAAFLSMILALAVGIPSLRLRGIYLALATIAFVEVFRVLCLNLEITGGAIGIFDIPQIFENRFDYIKIFAPFLILALIITHRIERSRAGRAFKSIREDELAAESIGINPTRYKVLAFTTGAALAGVTGAMSAPFLNTWNARQGTFDASVAYLAYLLIGGTRTYWGAVLGAFILAALPEILRPLQDFRLIINGIVLIIATIFMPEGITGLIAKIRNRTGL